MSQTPDHKPTLSVIIPAYNEADRLGATLRTIAAYADRTGRPVEVLVVDDGSSDTTADIARSFNTHPLRLRVLVNDTNRGKGGSVRRGMLEATGDIRLMYDADGSTPIDEIAKATHAIEHEHYDIAIGSRAHPDSILDPAQRPLRRAVNLAFRLGVRLLVPLPAVRDTQCGFKAFTRAAAQDLFQRATTDGFAFDVEILALARRLRYRVKEIPITWRNDLASTVNLLHHGPEVFRALLRIRRRLRQISPPSKSP